MSRFNYNGDLSSTCKICGKTCNVLGNHLIEHHISAKEYYDTYIRKPDEGKCVICGKDTKFKTIKIGYIGKYCSHECHYANSPNRDSSKWKSRREQKIKEFESKHKCTFANDLRKQYGNGWYQSNIVKFIYMDSQTKFVRNSDIGKIIQYASIIRPHFSTSHAEKELVDFIKSFYKETILENNRKAIYPKELDIYLPDLKLAIEYNGCYYHSVQHGCNPSYHLDKSLMCRQKQIRLIHIYEFEDFDKQKDLLKSLILGTDKYPKNDFNKNNLLKSIPKPEIIFNNGYTLYGAGKLEVN